MVSLVTSLQLEITFDPGILCPQRVASTNELPDPLVLTHGRSWQEIREGNRGLESGFLLLPPCGVGRVVWVWQCRVALPLDSSNYPEGTAPTLELSSHPNSNSAHVTM